MLLFAQTGAEAIAGSAGWAGAGLLGLMLAWLLLVHLPAQTKQFRDFWTEAREERDRAFDRHRLEIQDLHKQHESDAEKDRDAFLRRAEFLAQEIRMQTTELKAAILGQCKFSQNVERK